MMDNPGVVIFVGFVVAPLLFIGLIYLFTHDKEIEAKVNERRREKAFKEIMSEHPDWVEELNVQELQEQKEEDLERQVIEARKRLRDEFEKAAKEHPEWLK